MPDNIVPVAAPVVFKEEEDKQQTQNIAANLSAAIGQPVGHEDVTASQELSPDVNAAVAAIPEPSQSENKTMDKEAKDAAVHDKGTFLSRWIGGIFAKKIGKGPSRDMLALKQHDVNRRSQGKQKLGN